MPILVIRDLYDDCGMTLDPQAKAHLERLAALNLPPVSQVTPQEARRRTLVGIRELSGEPEPLAAVENRTIPGPGGPLPVRIYRPEGEAPFPALVYYHGGGWVVCNLDTHDAPCAAIANRTGCVVVSVDYRLAPEHRFPAAVEDAWAALEWVAGHADEIGVDPRRLAVGGDSAGGTLAAVVARWARERGGPALACQVLVYPVTDADLNTESSLRNADGYALTRDSMAWYWDQYLPAAHARSNPDAAPLRAVDLSGLPPALVITCEYDPLLDEGTAYARRLGEAGVPVTHISEPGMVHGFFRWAAVTDRTSKSYDDVAAALRAEFAEGPTR
jgi:acetyl esterase